MLFWLFVIIFIIGILIILLGVYAENNAKFRDAFYKESRTIKSYLYYYSDEIKFAGKFTVVITIISIVCMLFIMCGKHADIKAQVEADKETYIGIKHKVTSEACRDEFGLLSKEVVDEAQSWNEYIKLNQTLQDNFWVGIFYPNVYDQFETISYEEQISKID